MLGYIIAVLVTLVVAVPVSSIITSNVQKKSANSKIGNAEEKAREIIDEALTTAEAKKREGILESRKNLFVQRMSLIKRSKNAEPRFRRVREESSRRKRLSNASLTPSRKRKPV